MSLAYIRADPDMKDSTPWTKLWRKIWCGLPANGVQAAPYVFIQTRTVDEAKAAAKIYLEKSVSGYAVKFPVAVDVESKIFWTIYRCRIWTNVVNAFSDTIAAAGYTPIVYK